jgi:hypothetical protein
MLSRAALPNLVRIVIRPTFSDMAVRPPEIDDTPGRRAAVAGAAGRQRR